MDEEIFLKKLKKEFSMVDIDLSNLLPIFDISNNYEVNMFINNFINFAMNGEKSKKINDTLKILLNIIFNVSDTYLNSFKHIRVNDNQQNSLDLNTITIRVKEFCRKNLKVLKGKSDEAKTLNDTLEIFENDLDELCFLIGVNIHVDLEEMGDCLTESVQNVLFEHNTMGILFYFLSKFKNEMKKEENRQLMVKILKLFKFSVCKNVNNQFLILQSEFLKIMEFILNEYWREGKFLVQFCIENFEKHIIFCEKFFLFIIDRIRMTKLEYYKELVFYWKIIERFAEEKVYNLLIRLKYLFFNESLIFKLF